MYIPEVSDHFAEFDFNLDLLSFQWLVCLFSGKLREDTVNTVWNLFFLQGISVIFRVALTIIKVLEKDILELDRFDEILMLIQNYSENEFTAEMLLKNFFGEIQDEEIRLIREKHRVKILEDIKNHLKQSSSRVVNVNPRITFIKKFFSFNGFADYFAEHKDKSEKHKAAWQLLKQPIDAFESSLMDIYTCDPKWPICIFDFTFKNINPKFVVLKVYDNIDKFVVDDYFYGETNKLHGKGGIEES